MHLAGSGGTGASAALVLLDDVRRHRLRRAALHLPPRSQERGPSQFSDRLLGNELSYDDRNIVGTAALVRHGNQARTGGFQA